jgi:hypothetical protein
MKLVSHVLGEPEGANQIRSHASITGYMATVAIDTLRALERGLKIRVCRWIFHFGDRLCPHVYFILNYQQGRTPAFSSVWQPLLPGVPSTVFAQVQDRRLLLKKKNNDQYWTGIGHIGGNLTCDIICGPNWGRFGCHASASTLRATGYVL